MRFSAATTAERILPQWLVSRAHPLLEALDALLSASDERSTAGRISVIAFLIRTVSAAIAFVSQVLLARWMGGTEYGIFVLVWVTMIIVGNLACLGFHTSVIRFIPEYRETGRLAELRGILVTSRLFSLLLATAFAAIGATGIWLLSPGIESYYVVPFFLGLFTLPMIALGDVLQGIARANTWAMWALSPTYLVRPVLILIFMAGALMLGYEASAVTAVISAILATYATTVFQLVSITTRVDRNVPAGPRKVLLGHWIAVSFPIFLVEGFFFLLTNADVLVLGFYVDPDHVGVYYATVKTIALVHFVYFAVKAGVAQRYAELNQTDDKTALAAFARETVQWTFWPSLAMGAIVLVLGKPMLALFGPGFVDGYPLLFLLVAGVVARGAVGPAESLLNMSGYQNACATVYAATLALNIVLNVILIPMIGLWGAAIATAVAMGFEAASLSLTVWRKLGITMFAFAPHTPAGVHD